MVKQHTQKYPINPDHFTETTHKNLKYLAAHEHKTDTSSVRKPTNSKSYTESTSRTFYQTEEEERKKQQPRAISNEGMASPLITSKSRRNKTCSVSQPPKGTLIPAINN